MVSIGRVQSSKLWILLGVQDKAIEKEPEKDPELGQGEDNPGLSCIDILENGGEKASGLYWVKVGEKPAF